MSVSVTLCEGKSVISGKCEGGNEERYEGHTECGHKENPGKPTYEGSVFGMGTINVVAFVLSL